MFHSKMPNSSLFELVELTTDGAPSKTGKENGAGVLLKYLQESDFKQDVISLHCFIHQESLSAQSIKMTHGMGCRCERR